MRLKPKLTQKNEPALWYKRYTDIQTSSNFNGLYKTSDNKYWTFNADTLSFNEETDIPTGVKIVAVNGVMAYGSHYYKYDNGWFETTDTTNLSKLYSNNIGKYQVNKYYFVCSFNYVHRGSVEGSTTQIMRGMIMPLQTMEIQHYCDDVLLSPDDLVVCENKLWSVENSIVDHKHLPKHFNIYSCTLNSIL